MVEVYNSLSPFHTGQTSRRNQRLNDNLYLRDVRLRESEDVLGIPDIKFKFHVVVLDYLPTSDPTEPSA